MQIPGSRKAVDPAAEINLSPLLKPLPPLAAVTITLSRQLIYFYRMAYLLFASSVFFVIFPWMAINPLWLIVLAGSWCGLWISYRSQINTLFSGSVWFERAEWWLKADNRKQRKYQFAGEVLCWSLFIIVPLQSMDSGRRKYLLVANDALSPADRARLRTWLRVCLKPKS